MKILNSVTNLALLTILSRNVSSNSICGDNSKAFCIDSKKYYICNEDDINVTSTELSSNSFLQFCYIMDQIETGNASCNVHECNEGICDDIEGICNKNLAYEPKNECNHCYTSNSYACTSFTTYKYCDNFTIKGSEHLECPKGQVCHYNQPQGYRNPCVDEKYAKCHLFLHCYLELNDTDIIVKDYSYLCEKFGDGFLLPSDENDSQRYTH